MAMHQYASFPGHMYQTKQRGPEHQLLKVPCKRTQTQCPAEDYQPDPTATQESPNQGVYAPPSYETAAEAKDTTPYTTRSGRQVNQVAKPVRLDYGHWLSVA